MNREAALPSEELRRIQRRKTAVAADGCRDALKQGEHRRVAVAVDVAVRVDEARADKAARRIEHARALRRHDAPCPLDARHAPILYKHIADKAVLALGVEHRAAPDE